MSNATHQEDPYAAATFDLDEFDPTILDNLFHQQCPSPSQAADTSSKQHQQTNDPVGRVRRKYKRRVTTDTNIASHISAPIKPTPTLVGDNRYIPIEEQDYCGLAAATQILVNNFGCLRSKNAELSTINVGMAKLVETQRTQLMAQQAEISRLTCAMSNMQEHVDALKRSRCTCVRECRHTKHKNNDRKNNKRIMDMMMSKRNELTIHSGESNDPNDPQPQEEASCGEDTTNRSPRLLHYH